MLTPSHSSALPLSEENRLAALQRYHILDTPAEPSFDRLTALAADIFALPYAGINFLDADRAWYKSSFGLSLGSLPRAGSFCERVLRDQNLFVVEDASEDPCFRDNPLVTAFPHLRFYAGAPLRTPDGFTLGTLCLAAPRPHEFPASARNLLTRLAAVVMREVELHLVLAQQDSHLDSRLLTAYNDLEARSGRRTAELEEHIAQRTAALEQANRELQAQVAERKAAQKRLKESKQRYRSLFEQNKDAVYSFNPEGRFLSANAACEALCGYPQQELLQMSFRELIVPEYRERALEMFGTALQGEAKHDEIALIHRDGRRVEISVSKIPIVVGGEVVGVYGVARNITARKELERERERLLAEALERADRDSLTGLLNHRAFHKRFQDELAHAAQTGQPLTVALLNLNDFRFFNDAYGHIAGDDVLRRVAGALREIAGPAEEVVLARYGGDEFALLLPGGTSEQAAALAAQLHSLDYAPPGYSDIIPLTLAIGAAQFPGDGATRLQILSVAEARLRRDKNGEDARADRLRAALAHSVEGFTMLDALVTAVDSKDRYTRRHSEDVLMCSGQIAEALGLDDRDRRIVAAAALLHDIGKIGVPDAVLRKPGGLTDAEFQAIKQHPMMGAIIVGAVPGFEDTLDAIRHHHERWDGEGYPFGLKGCETPLIARLMAVADAFSAMTTDRPYRKGMSEAQALSVLEQGTGTQWDPECVAAFLRARRGNASAHSQ